SILAQTPLQNTSTSLSTPHRPPPLVIVSNALPLEQSYLFFSSMNTPSNELKTEIKNKVIETFPHMNVLSIGQLVDALALIWHVETMESDSPGPQDDPYFNLKTEPSFFKTNLPRNITKQTSTTVDLCLPSYSKSGTNYHNPFYDDPQFKETVSLVLKKIEDISKDIIVLAGVSGGGKTSTAFGIAVERWSIYIDFSPLLGYYGVHLTSELQQIRGVKPQFERIDQQNEAFHLLDVAVVSRGLLLIKMMVEKKISTPKEWLLAQLQMDDSEIRNILGFEKYNTLSITTLITKINSCLKVGHLVLICDEAQILCRNEFGKYQGSLHDNEWNLLQGYVAHLLQHPIKSLLAGTYMHMASGISLLTSVGKVPNLHVHIVLKLPFLSHDDVLRNLDAVIDLTHVTPEILNFLGYILRGRPRNCAFFVRMLISTQRSNGKTKDLVLREVIQLWYDDIFSGMEKYLKNACEYFGTDNLNPEKAIMDVLRLRVFYNHKYKEAIELLQHSIIPCQSPECIILGPDDRTLNEIEINPSFESYLVDSIVLFLEKRRKKKMVDVFVDNIITLNNIPSIGNEFDAVFVTAIIQKRGFNVQEELNRWKNGQQFDLPSWITSTMKFITTSNLSGSVPIAKYVNDMTYCSYAIQPDIYSGSDMVVSLMDDEQNVVLLSASCTISVELPHRKSERPELFRFNEYGDLVIIVDDRNMKYVFGSAIEALVERISYKENQENSMDETE
ncbi:16658_t:CDS:2, partial [Funneliformis caledonium]